MKKTNILLLALILPWCLITAQTMQWVVRPTLAHIENYGSLLKVRKDGKTGLMNPNQQIVVPVLYDSISPFIDGYAIAMTINGKQLMIDALISDGDYEILPVQEKIYATSYLQFSEGKMPVKGEGGWGYLGTDGNMAIPCQFQKAYPFSEGIASVLIDDKAYYIDRNMDYMAVEAGYGNLVFASTFVNSQAVVYSGNSYTPKGYIINKHGRIISQYKVKPERLKVNKDHSVGDKAAQINSQTNQMSVNSQYEVYERNGLYGYKKEGHIVLPAQFDYAEPVKGTLAAVRYKGKEGLLRIVEGSVTTAMENDEILYEGGTPNAKACVQINLPAEMEDASLTVKVIDSDGKEVNVQANVAIRQHRNNTFLPNTTPKEDGPNFYELEIWSESLLLSKDDIAINYTIKKKTATTKVTTYIAENKVPKLSISHPKATSKRANPKNDFYIAVAVNNSGDAYGNGSVTLYVNDQLVGSKSVGVRSHGIANAVFAIPGIKKERYARVNAVLKNGTSQESNIHFMPFN